MTTRERVSADEIKRAISNRISAGLYPPGSRLPSVRTIAEELGANRNTVNKAYQALQQAGLVALQSGGNAFQVCETPPQANFLEHFRGEARGSVWRAMAAGITVDTVRAELNTIVDAVYGQNDVAIRFIECNQHDTEQLSAELERLTGASIAAGLLSDLDTNASQLAERYDLIVTTFHHLAEVNRALLPFQEKIIGVDTRPNHNVLLQLARLGPQRVGLICSLDNTAVMLRHTIQSYQPQCAIETILDDNDEAIRRVAAQENVLVVTHTCRDHVLALTGREPEIVVDFRIDEQSSLFLRQRIRTLRQLKGGATIGTMPGVEV